MGAPCNRMRWDHPRACGEHFLCLGVGERGEGSSPRLRGTPRGPARPGGPQGIIPALAGNTVSTNGSNTNGGDHPRACGEHIRRANGQQELRGSSPRLRGTRTRGRADSRWCGIIPALAGNTSVVAVTVIGWWDHPRACGEHGEAFDQHAGEPGSSPRLRGTRAVQRALGDMEGIIPALAGNTRSRLRRRGLHWDHPRACGEHTTASNPRNDIRGSSPRLRGTRSATWVFCFLAGIIPALAGNTLSSRATRSKPRDHPRACGEHPRRERTNPTPMGSSPRLRGTQHPHPRRRWPGGIIPALAGNTVRPVCTVHARRDHPRACGEHPSRCTVLSPLAGSSPRLRGTPGRRGHRHAGRRIIPALAGNTHLTPPSLRLDRDHPRACGEHRYDRYAPFTRVGIIPALAGNTGRVWRTAMAWWDHPRACGEHLVIGLLEPVGLGSSPRLRGTLLCGVGGLLFRGIIPALAGNTARVGLL